MTDWWISIIAAVGLLALLVLLVRWHFSMRAELQVLRRWLAAFQREEAERERCRQEDGT